MATGRIALDAGTSERHYCTPPIEILCISDGEERPRLWTRMHRSPPFLQTPLNAPDRGARYRRGGQLPFFALFTPVLLWWEVNRSEKYFM